ncbi:fungal-specific transcription factor domain-containing protein [Aspergillus unguis]
MGLGLARYAASFEERCQHMDNLCERLEGLAKTLSDCIASTHIDLNGASASFSPVQHGKERILSPSQPNAFRSNDNSMPETNETPHHSPSSNLGAVSERSGNSQGVDPQAKPTPVDAVGHMVADSYGRLRYIGGATNKMMIDAVQSLSPGTIPKPTPADNPPISLPFFIQGQVWPELPYLPQPQDLSRPPQYVSDLLVGIYFDQLHYTFPILYKPDFMRRYQALNSGKRGSDAAVGRGFVSIFFAVCACASSLLPRAPGSSSLPGIEYYQKALLLHFASSGEVFLEQVQCLGLLALCSAGWNTLSQSWRFAGQAVRLAQDLGLHVSSLKELSLDTLNPNAHVEAQVARCTWWSVFTLDCLMSICLGRPMAADEADCCCDLPFDISNDYLEQFGVPKDQDPVPSASSPMTGFLAFTRLCRIAARVHKFYSSTRIRAGARDGATVSDGSSCSWTTLLPTLDIFVRDLDEWLQNLPNEICFSANMAQSGPNLTMCVIVFILHSGTIMNLYRPLAAHYSATNPHPHHEPGSGNLSDIPISSSLLNPGIECINAAKSCIHAAELIRERVVPSHYLAFCVQYLTISGILLLSMDDKTEDLSLLPDVKRALRFLGDLEAIWPGASRSRLILDKLLVHPRAKDRDDGPTGSLEVNPDSDMFASADSSSNWYPSLPVLDGLLWEQFPDPSEIFLNMNSLADIT